MSFQTLISEDPPTLLVGERLRDGRIALGTRVRGDDGEWEPGDFQFLPPAAQLDLAAWLTAAVEEGWSETIRERSGDPMRTAWELYGEGPGALRQLAVDTLSELSPDLLRRAMVLLANALGPSSRERIVERINRTDDASEEMELRRMLADAGEGFAYAVAAAGLFDALARGLLPEDIDSIL